MCINNSLDNILNASEQEQLAFINEIRKREYLLKTLYYSGEKKYKIEFYLFKISPFNVLKTYKLLRRGSN